MNGLETIDAESLRHVIHSLAGDEAFSKNLVDLIRRDKGLPLERIAQFLECRALWAREMQMELRGNREGARQVFEERQAMARAMRKERRHV